MSRKLLLALSATVGTLVLVPSADAFTTLPVWQCRASPSWTSVNAGNRVEPFAANGNINTARGASPDHAQCAPAEAGAGNTATQIGIPQDLLGARTAGAITTITPELGRAIDQKVTSDAKVENVTLQLPRGGTVTLGVNAASSTAEGRCESGRDTPTLHRLQPGRGRHARRQHAGARRPRQGALRPPRAAAADHLGRPQRADPHG